MLLEQKPYHTETYVAIQTLALIAEVPEYAVIKKQCRIPPYDGTLPFGKIPRLRAILLHMLENFESMISSFGKTDYYPYAEIRKCKSVCDRILYDDFAPPEKTLMNCIRATFPVFAETAMSIVETAMEKGMDDDGYDIFSIGQIENMLDNISLDKAFSRTSLIERFPIK